ncbi:MAG TPA: NAD-dependent epimerase/dehydratase family protein [Stellaceae bacterium]|nr:NAD-dependent epimerase/dehydratase family protein [Stellaceae bacterium]
MTVLVTGAAGFIGFHVSATLLRAGESVIGIDNLNPYYDVRLKEARLAELRKRAGFSFERLELAQERALLRFVERNPGIDRVVHLAAQAGVRHSLEEPRAYVSANLVGQVEVLEACRQIRGLKHLVFASTSSVYGGNTKLPFSVADPVETPQSLYAATKRADELMAYCYAHLHRIPVTGLRYFTVYGPWGRPDMAAWIFTEAILAGRPIRLFNHGKMQRDFTYIDDIVAGTLACLANPPADDGSAPPYRLYNLGNHRCEELEHFVAVLERATGRKAQRELLPMQPGDVAATYADIDSSRRDFGFDPKTPIDEGLPRFVAWYRQYRGI